MFTMGLMGEAAAASLTIDHTSCFWPATRAAGLKGSSRRVVADIARKKRGGVEVGDDTALRSEQLDVLSLKVTATVLLISVPEQID